jgi:hypothetical protein
MCYLRSNGKGIMITLAASHQGNTNLLGVQTLNEIAITLRV